MKRTITAAIAALALAAIPATAGAVLVPRTLPGAAVSTSLAAQHHYGADGISVTGTLTLTVSGTPVAGQTVTFTAYGLPLCDAVTGADGLASCPVTMAQVALDRSKGGVFRATFAGTATLAATEGSGHI